MSGFISFVVLQTSGSSSRGVGFSLSLQRFMLSGRRMGFTSLWSDTLKRRVGERAMADQIEQLGMTIENHQKQIQELQAKYDYQVQQSFDLGKQLDATQNNLNLTSKLLAKTENDLQRYITYLFWKMRVQPLDPVQMKSERATWRSLAVFVYHASVVENESSAIGSYADKEPGQFFLSAFNECLSTLSMDFPPPVPAASKIGEGKRGRRHKQKLAYIRQSYKLMEHLGHIPYRQQAHTFASRFIGGRTKTCIIATVSPAVSFPPSC
ncbi:hypothetical protein OROMI_018473 [Orobanche minor]